MENEPLFSDELNTLFDEANTKIAILYCLSKASEDSDLSNGLYATTSELEMIVDKLAESARHN